MSRRLAAIAVLDVVGYSRLMEASEATTLAAFRTLTQNIVEPQMARHQGRIVKSLGDGFLTEFSSVVSAVECAAAIQAELAKGDSPLKLRIGINFGDVQGEGDDILGDGVNIAARLEALAPVGGICISQKVRDELHGKIELGFKDLGQVTLKNISRPVQAFVIGGEAASGTRETTAAGANERPSLAVLPFANLSGDPTQQYLSDGITQDIITELMRFRSFDLVQWHAAAQVKHTGQEPVEAAKALGATHLVSGSLRSGGGRLRISVQLIEAKTGKSLWAERYDRQAVDIFAVQDEVVAAFAATLEDRVVMAAIEATRNRPTESWSAYDFLLQGRALCDLYREFEAVPLFARALALDPNFAQAHAWMGLAQAVATTYQFAKNELEEARLHVKRALELDSNDATSHWSAAVVFMSCGDHAKSWHHFERALALNPTNLQIWADRSNWLRYMGRSEEALAEIDRVIASAQFPLRWFFALRGGILFDLKRYGDAIECYANAPGESVSLGLIRISAIYHSGDQARAKQELAAVLQANPWMTQESILVGFPFQDKKLLDHFLAGLIAAGLPQA